MRNTKIEARAVALLGALVLLADCDRAEPPSDVASGASGDTAAAHVAVAEGAQVAQLRGAGTSPESIDDKLFVLWEYAGALRERALAAVVEKRAVDPEVGALAKLVRDGHQLGMDVMRPIAVDLAITLPEVPTAIELAAIEAASKLPPADLERFFLRRQRAMHAWDVTVFDDYGAVAKNERLKRYVAATRAPLREHAALVDRLARKKGVADGATLGVAP
jgi:putative membrane protein